VFDGAASTARAVANVPRGVKVLFSPEGVIADDVIRDLVAAEPEGRVVVVVTNDQEVVRDVRAAGARAVASEALIGLLAR
jgi:rRNA-processing protein FCF1